MQAPLRWLNDKIRSKDIYGKSITFTYKGEEQYTTFIGGLTSIVIKFIIFVFGLSILLNMVNRKNTNSSVNRIINNIMEDTGIIDFEGSDFIFFLRIQYIVNQTKIKATESNSFFNISVKHTKRTGIFFSGNMVQENTYLNTKRCNDSFISHSEQLERFFSATGPYA